MEIRYTLRIKSKKNINYTKPNVIRVFGKGFNFTKHSIH